MSADKRVRYTKLFLKESLIKLLKEKPISRITIKELCEDAEINRATYYAHYSDQFDQLKQIEEELISGILSNLNELSAETREKDLLKIVENILVYINENAELCRVLLGRNGDIDFQENIIEIIQDQIPLIMQSKKAINDSTVDDLFIYMSTGSLGIIRKWLFNESDKRTPQEIASFIVKLTNSGLILIQNNL